MQTFPPTHRFNLATPWWLAACAALALSACGGGTPGDNDNSVVESQSSTSAPLATGTTTLALETDALAESADVPQALPSFHVAPVVLDAPDDADAADPSASAYRQPHVQSIPAAQADLPTQRLTLPQIEAAGRLQRLSATRAGADAGLAPMVNPSVAATYTPAQIRAAYGLPALPPAGTTLTAKQAAQLGAGQTIYIVNAMHNPNAAAELAAFNQKFGLPACTTKLIAPTATLPLPKASSTACEFSVVYNTAAGGMTTTAPAYNSGWATEIALDVQWAHATAPLARIVLIEAADASLNTLLGGVKLANAMGPGVVSMSFGANEGTYTASVDGAFTGAGMSYLAATGDSGAAVSWPSVSTRVLAVGGTTLRYSGTGPRSEVVWSGTGGGISAYTATPSYQNAKVPEMGTPARRTVADVAFNADPSTGQYTAVMTPGSATVNWLSVGGTSLSTPQWAGLLAVANAMRQQNAKSVLGDPHAILNTQIAAVPGTYAASFADITTGSHGTCAGCSARIGYDAPTGLGTPQAGKLLEALTGIATPVAAPVVTPATVSAQVGTALTFTVSAAAPNAVTYTLIGAPAGMTIASSGAVSWPVPTVGKYVLTVRAKDNVTGLAGEGQYTVDVAPAAPPTVVPIVGSATVSASPGKAFTYAVTVKSQNPVTYSLGGAPAGMTISTTGVLSWSNPVIGNYAVVVTAVDSKTGQRGAGTVNVQVAAMGPVISFAPMVGKVGTALTGTISVGSVGAAGVSVSISGIPMGMMFSVSGLTFTARWASPVQGNYTLNVVVVDSTGKKATAAVPVTITAK